MTSLFATAERFWRMLWKDTGVVMATALVCAGLKLPCAHAAASGGIVCNDCVESCLLRARGLKCMLRVSSVRMTGSPTRFYLLPFSDDAYRVEIGPDNAEALEFVRDMMTTRAFCTTQSTKYMTQTDYGQCVHNDAMNVCNASGGLSLLLASRVVFLDACAAKDTKKKKRLYDVLRAFRMLLPAEDDFVFKFGYADFVGYFERYFFIQKEDKDER